MAKLTFLIGLGSALYLSVAALPASAQIARPAPNNDAAWAAAYAGISINLCGVYALDTEAVLNSGGLYSPDAPEWQDDGTALLAFRQGGHAAKQAFTHDPLFCADPAYLAAGRAELVRRFLTPRGGNGQNAAPSPQAR